MAWSPNPNPDYGIGPYPGAPVLLPSTAKSVMTDNTNAVKVIDHSIATLLNYRILLSQIDLIPNGALSAGRIWLFLALTGQTSGFVLRDDLAIASQSPATTTAGARINFPTWTSGKPFVVPEGYDLWAASNVVQSTPPSIDCLGKLF